MKRRSLNKLYRRRLNHWTTKNQLIELMDRGIRFSRNTNNQTPKAQNGLQKLKLILIKVRIRVPVGILWLVMKAIGIQVCRVGVRGWKGRIVCVILVVHKSQLMSTEKTLPVAWKSIKMKNRDKLAMRNLRIQNKDKSLQNQECTENCQQWTCLIKNQLIGWLIRVRSLLFIKKNQDKTSDQMLDNRKFNKILKK